MPRILDDSCEVRCCAECGEVLEEKHHGDEGWSVCDNCGTIEGGSQYKYWCDNCQEMSDTNVCTNCNNE